MLGLQAALYRGGLLPLLRRSLCASVKDDVTAAQNELDEFFGAQYHAPDSAHSISSADSVGTARDVRDADSQLSHVDASGRASMVEVAHKDSSVRIAKASAVVHVGNVAFQLIEADQIKKGDVLSTAQLAGIMAAKQTSTLIPLCHNLFISKADVQLHLLQDSPAVQVVTEVRTVGQTGVEMEALTAASVAALTVYDMCKAVNKDIVISDLQLDFKSGGKSGVHRRMDGQSA